MEKEDFLKLADSIEAKLTAVSEDRKASDKARAEELSKLGEEQHALARSFAELEQKVLSRAPETASKDVSLGARFAASDAYKAFGEHRSRQAAVSLASILTPSGAVPSQHIPGVQGKPFLGLEVEAAFAHVPTVATSIDYLKSTTETNAAAFVAEGAVKPESAFAFAPATANVRTIATWVKISRQLADDAGAVAAYINNRLAYFLDAKVEDQLINGNGSGQNLPGIFVSGNYTPHGLTDTSLTPLDVIRKSATLMRVAGYRPSLVFLNPLDYDDIIGAKDQELRYLIANPTGSNNQSLWGLRPVQSSSITAGQFLVADPSMGATIYDRMATEVAMFEQDETNVQYNLITVRAERRLAFAIENTACFVGGALEIS